MRSSCAVALLMCMGLAASSAKALDPVPQENRIVAAAVSNIVAPAGAAMHMPTDVAVDSKGRVYVADGANDRIVWFDADGRFGAAISDIEGQKLKRPVGIDIDSRDQLWIADTGNHRILAIGTNGRIVANIAPPATNQGNAADPTDVLVTAAGRRVYVADNSNHRLLIYDTRGGAWTSLGGFGRALGQFQWPFMLCRDANSYVYVSEAIGARVQRLSPGDKLAGQIGKWGVTLGEFYRPKGVAADAKGRVFAGDSTMGVIQVFSARGLVQGVLTDKGGMPLKFQHPMGMCFDKNGRLYVAELGANRVAVVKVE